MADIFLSYAREDREKAERLAKALEGQGWSVFWDRTIPPGLTWRSYIGKALEEAGCLVVAWSAASIGSEWVLEEADLGKQRGILIPVLFEAVEPPLGFRALQALDLAAWAGRPDAPALRDLVAGMERLLGPPPGRETPARDAPEAQRTAGTERRRAEAWTERRPAEGPSRGPARFLRSWPSAAVAGLLLVAISLWVWRPWERWVTEDTPVEESEDAHVPSPPTWEEDELLNHRIRINGGHFKMGSPEGPLHEQPQHRVQLSSFYIQEHEVTNEEYRRFKPGHEFPEGQKKHPVANVTWEEATEYADWVGGRLPTEAEWEYAARSGGLDQPYPWGDETADCSRAIFKDEHGNGCGSDSTWPVCSLEKGKTEEGLCDMAGNVWEWVHDWYTSSTYKNRGKAAEDPQGPGVGEARVIRGGGYRENWSSARSAFRNAMNPTYKGGVGFRVAFPPASSDEQ